MSEIDPANNNSYSNSLLNSETLVKALGSDVIEILRCGICADFYEVPIVLPCGHTFCLNCLTQMCTNATRRQPVGSSRDVRVGCPSCHVPIYAAPILSRNVTCNVTVKALLESLRGKEAEPTSTQSRGVNTDTPECDTTPCFPGTGYQDDVRMARMLSDLDRVTFALSGKNIVDRAFLEIEEIRNGHLTRERQRQEQRDAKTRDQVRAVKNIIKQAKELQNQQGPWQQHLPQPQQQHSQMLPQQQQQQQPHLPSQTQQQQHNPNLHDLQQRILLPRQHDLSNSHTTCDSIANTVNSNLSMPNTLKNSISDITSEIFSKVTQTQEHKEEYTNIQQTQNLQHITRPLSQQHQQQHQQQQQQQQHQVVPQTSQPYALFPLKNILEKQLHGHINSLQFLQQETQQQHRFQQLALQSRVSLQQMQQQQHQKQQQQQQQQHQQQHEQSHGQRQLQLQQQLTWSNELHQKQQQQRLQNSNYNISALPGDSVDNAPLVPISLSTKSPSCQDLQSQQPKSNTGTDVIASDVHGQGRELHSHDSKLNGDPAVMSFSIGDQSELGDQSNRRLPGQFN